MSKLVPLLALTTAVLAGATAYLAVELHRTRAELDRAAIAAGPQVAGSAELAGFAPPGITGAPSTGGSAAKAGATPGPATSAAGNQASVPAAQAADAPGDPQRAMMLSYARQWLAQFDDPGQRASLLKQARAGISAQYGPLKDKLGLSDETFAQMVDLVADQNLEAQEHYLRCLTVSGCDTSKLSQPADHTQEFLALLGNVGFEEFKTFSGAMSERQLVAQLRGRLSDSSGLRDGDAERLVKVMSEETGKFRSESEQQGASLAGWGTGNAMLWYTKDGSADQQLSSATQYAQRLRQRAAGILTADQLRVFAQLQEELLESFASYLRSSDHK
jgi:hypothetical protein